MIIEENLILEEAITALREEMLNDLAESLPNDSGFSDSIEVSDYLYQ